MPKSCERRVFSNLQMLGRVWRSHRHSDLELRWKLQAPSPRSTRTTRWMSSGYRNLWMFVDDGPMHQPSPWMMTMTMLAGAVQLHAWWASEWHLELATLPPLYKQQAAEEHQIQSAEASSNVQKLLLCCRHEDQQKKTPSGPTTRTPQNRVQGPRNNLWSEIVDESTHSRPLSSVHRHKLQSPMCYGNCDRNLTAGNVSTRVF